MPAIPSQRRLVLPLTSTAAHHAATRSDGRRQAGDPPKPRGSRAPLDRGLPDSRQRVSPAPRGLDVGNLVIEGERRSGTSGALSRPSGPCSPGRPRRLAEETAAFGRAFGWLPVSRCGQAGAASLRRAVRPARLSLDGTRGGPAERLAVRDRRRPAHPGVAGPPAVGDPATRTSAPKSPTGSCPRNRTALQPGLRRALAAA